MFISKKKVIEALKTEILTPGAWVTTVDELGYAIPVDNKCPVCAVGAALRGHGLDDNRVCELGDSLVFSGYDVSSSASKEDIKGALEDGKYMAALSAYFESVVAKYKNVNGKRARTSLINFVKKNFPVRFKFK